MIFNNAKAWHQVTPFKIPKTDETQYSFRDIFTTEIHDTIEYQELSGWKDEKPR